MMNKVKEALLLKGFIERNGCILKESAQPGLYSTKQVYDQSAGVIRLFTTAPGGFETEQAVMSLSSVIGSGAL